MTETTSRFPDAHILRAALRAGRLIDEHGSSVERLRTSYSLYASDALYPPSDLRAGEQLLIEAQLLNLRDGVLHITGELSQLVRLENAQDAIGVLVDRIVAVAIATGDGTTASDDQLAEFIRLSAIDAERREQMLLALASRYDDCFCSTLGAIAEEFVQREAQDRLGELGRSDLARDVRRVSLVSDALGYDIVVPTLANPIRLEVKGSTRDSTAHFTFHISRNEADWGARDDGWYLVAVSIDRATLVPRLEGHCRGALLVDHLPCDSGYGCWTGAEIELPVSILTRGLPPLI